MRKEIEKIIEENITGFFLDLPALTEQVKEILKGKKINTEVRVKCGDKTKDFTFEEFEKLIFPHS